MLFSRHLRFDFNSDNFGRFVGWVALGIVGVCGLQRVGTVSRVVCGKWRER